MLLYVLGGIFAGIGITLIIGALLSVSLLIGALVNGMIVLISGTAIDALLARRNRKTA